MTAISIVVYSLYYRVYVVPSKATLENGSYPDSLPVRCVTRLPKLFPN